MESWRGIRFRAPIVQVYHEKSVVLPDVARVLACLYAKDVVFETHTTSHDRSLLRQQVATNVPVPFYDGPTFLEDSREICRYIAEKYEHHGHPFLLGRDAPERASVERWLRSEEHALSTPSRALCSHLIFPQLDDDEDDINKQARKLDEVLEVYDRQLSDSEFLVGDRFTLADLVHIPDLHYIASSARFMYLLDSRSNVARWWDAISFWDSWRRVLQYMKMVEAQQRLEELVAARAAIDHELQERERKLHELERLRSEGERRGADVVRQVRRDPRKHIIAKSETVQVQIHPVHGDDASTRSGGEDDDSGPDEA